MKNDVYEMMDNVYIICDDYLVESDKKIKSIIACLEEIVDVNKKSSSVVEFNEKMRKDLYNNFNEVVEKSSGILNVERDHLAVVLLNLFNNYDEKIEIKRLELYLENNKKIIEKIKNSFQEVVEYIQSLQEKGKNRVNNYWLDKVNKEIDEMAEFMDSFYNNQYQKLLNIEEKAKKIVPLSKR